jgi:hypothetical protein
MLLRNAFIFVYLLVTMVIFILLDSSLSLWMSFFSNALILTFFTYYHIFIEKSYSPFLSTYIVFNYLFFLVVPMSQATTMGAMDIPIYNNNYPFNEFTFIKTNFLISIFHIVFFLFYVGTKTLIKRKSKIITNELKTSSIPLLYVFVILSIIVVALNWSFILDELTRPNWLVSTYSVSDLLIRKKVLFILPLGGVVLGMYSIRRKKLDPGKLFLVLLAIIILFAFLMILKNPLTEKRNALGPIYLLLLFLFYPKFLNSNVKTTFLLFFSMIVVFPAIQFLTHVDYGFAELLTDPSLIFRKNDLNEGYMSLNYDAFINIGVVMEIVEDNGLSYGFQSLSALLFFVPRSLWPAKPDSSGLVVGDHLIENYDFWFANLSNPLVSEGYLNFGYFGVILMAFLLAITVVYFLTWLKSSDFFKKSIAFYFAMHLIFLLRGDFTNGFSYFVGTFIGLYILPKLVIKIYHFVFKQHIWVSKKS